jgi:hypothetical protein
VQLVILQSRIAPRGLGSAPPPTQSKHFASMARRKLRGLRRALVIGSAGRIFTPARRRISRARLAASRLGIVAAFRNYRNRLLACSTASKWLIFCPASNATCFNCRAVAMTSPIVLSEGFGVNSTSRFAMKAASGPPIR